MLGEPSLTRRGSGTTLALGHATLYSLQNTCDENTGLFHISMSENYMVIYIKTQLCVY